MVRSASRTLGAARRRDGLSWQTALSLMAAALLLNVLGIYSTSSALARALEPVEKPEREKLTEFDLVDPENSFADVSQPNNRPPEGDARKGEFDSDVDHETQAPPIKPSSQSKPQQQQDAQPEGKESDASKQGDQDGDQDSKPGDESLVDADDGSTANQGVDSGSKGRPDPLSNLAGSTSMLDKTFGRPGSPDRMTDVDEGVDNMLDSKRHLYASFFNRLRDRVSENWRPEKAHKAADPNGTRFGDSTRMTVMMVRLDSEGKILKIEIERESGAPHLDEEAERAMRAAAPFPNLPEGLLDEKGHVDFRFGFILDFTGGSRIFRYGN